MNKTGLKNKLEWENKILTNNSGHSFKITEYVSTNEVHIIFIRTNYKKVCSLGNIKKGAVLDIYEPSVYGVGYFGEGIYSAKIDGIQIKYYKIWQSILQRCYDSNCSAYKNYGQRGVTICEDWKNYQNFAKWWNNNYKEYMTDWVIDKDILIKNNKIYSPETCCLVPMEINVIFTKRDTERGDYPIGVRLKTQTKNGYTTNCIIAQLNKGGEKIHLGTFKTSEDAFNAYKLAKEAYIKEVANFYKDLLDLKLYNALLNYEVEITD